jgi:hypothetical protein
MPVNGYFNNFPSQNRMNNEHMLMEDVIVESIQIMGHNIYYIPRESIDNMDMIFGETTKVKLEHAYLIEAYLNNVTGFEGDNDFFSKFGLEIRDTSSFVLSRRAFNKIIPSSLRARPQEGDLLYVPVLHKMFEIKFIEQELMFHSLGKKLPFVYEMRCEAFRYSQEEIDTGITEIDQVEEENAYTIKLRLSTSGTGNYHDNEVVYQSPNGNWNGATASGEVKEWFKSNGTIFVYNIEGNFQNNAPLYGNTSGAVYNTQTTDKMTDYVDRDLFDNQDFNEGATLILDLSEINPFGVP